MKNESILFEYFFRITNISHNILTNSVNFDRVLMELAKVADRNMNFYEENIMFPEVRRTAYCLYNDDRRRVSNPYSRPLIIIKVALLQRQIMPTI